MFEKYLCQLRLAFAGAPYVLQGPDQVPGSGYFLKFGDKEVVFDVTIRGDGEVSVYIGDYFMDILFLRNYIDLEISPEETKFDDFYNDLVIGMESYKEVGRFDTNYGQPQDDD